MKEIKQTEVEREPKTLAAYKAKMNVFKKCSIHTMANTTERYVLKKVER